MDADTAETARELIDKLAKVLPGDEMSAVLCAYLAMVKIVDPVPAARRHRLQIIRDGLAALLARETGPDIKLALKEE